MASPTRQTPSAPGGLSTSWLGGGRIEIASRRQSNGQAAGTPQSVSASNASPSQPAASSLLASTPNPEAFAPIHTNSRRWPRPAGSGSRALSSAGEWQTVGPSGSGSLWMSDNSHADDQEDDGVERFPFPPLFSENEGYNDEVAPTYHDEHNDDNEEEEDGDEEDQEQVVLDFGNILRSELPPHRSAPQSPETATSQTTLQPFIPPYLQEYNPSTSFPASFDRGPSASQLRLLPCSSSSTLSCLGSDIEFSTEPQPTTRHRRRRQSINQLSHTSSAAITAALARTGSTAAAIRSHIPILKRGRPSGIPVYYYEVKILSAGLSDAMYIAVGFVDGRFSNANLPGWTDQSIALHSDDGCIFEGYQDNGRKIGPVMEVGDVVGAGIDFATNQFFFTKNGVHIGEGKKKLSIDLWLKVFPCVGMRTPGERVKVNFGQEEFIFDLKKYVLSCKARALNHIMNSPLSPSRSVIINDESNLLSTTHAVFRQSHDPIQRAMDKIVLDFLLQNGYTTTASLLLKRPTSKLSKRPTADATSAAVQKDEITPYSLSRFMPISSADLAQAEGRLSIALKTKRLVSAITTAEFISALSLLDALDDHMVDKSNISLKRVLSFQLKCCRFAQLLETASKIEVTESTNLDGSRTRRSLKRKGSSELPRTAKIGGDRREQPASSPQPSSPDTLAWKQSEEALTYGRGLQREVERMPSLYKENLSGLLRRVFHLLAYKDLAGSTYLADVVGQDALVRLTEDVKNFVLTSTYTYSSSYLERTYQHSVVIHTEVQSRDLAPFLDAAPSSIVTREHCFL